MKRLDHPILDYIMFIIMTSEKCLQILEEITKKAEASTKGV
jgi:hypothetical protein